MASNAGILPAPYAAFVAALAGAVLAALWLSLIVWTAKDIRARSEERLAHILAVTSVALLTLPGLILYLLLRPAQTMEEAYQSSLEEEALLAALAVRPACPGCSRAVEPDWRICPTCSTLLRKPCEDCGRMLELSWNLCPYCGKAAAGQENEPAAG